MPMPFSDFLEPSSDIEWEKMIFRSMEPLFPPGLDENCAVDNLYAASWICSENALMQGKISPRALLGTKYLHCTNSISTKMM